MGECRKKLVFVQRETFNNSNILYPEQLIQVSPESFDIADGNRVDTDL